MRKTMKSKPKRTGGGGGGEDPFELCDVCKLNHDQGRRHKYFPSHVRSLSSLLSRFHNKIDALQSFLKNPAISPPEHSHLDRIWCVFCGVDVGGSGSPFACGDVIYHLASSEHLTNLKDFLRKHGGGMDRVDSFRVSDDELIKVGVVSDEKLLDLLEIAMSSDTAETVKRSRELMDSGVDPMALMSQLAALIMDIIAGSNQLANSQFSG